MDPLTSIPSQITAGDSYAITLSLSDYLASAGWSLTLTLAGPSVDSWTSTASGDSHALALSAAETSLLTAGTYQYAVRATLSTTVTTVERGALTVAADVAALAPGAAVSYWQTLRTTAQDALTTIMGGGAVQMVTIMGRQTMFRSPSDCLKVIAHCDQRLAANLGTFGTPMRFDVVGMR